MEESNSNLLDGVLTSDILADIVETITGNLGVLLPVGITIMAVLMGVSLIPRIIYRFF